jgi:tRNA modification GTPase
VQELIAAPSGKALTLAAAQLAGLPGKRIHGWINELQDLLANIEVIHDYAADDLDASLDQATLLTGEKLQNRLRELVAQMDSALVDSRRTQQLRSEVTIAICGPPNVGKSTLFNALLGHERALTAPEPGTTRDYLSESLDSAGVRLTLIDTAGYRETADAVEAAGVAQAEQWLSSADRVLWVQAADAPPAEPPNDVGTLRIMTRCDLLPAWPEQNGAGVHHVSGLTGRGIPELWQAVLASSSQLEEPALDSLGARQADAVSAARDSLQQALAALDAGMAMDAAAADIYAALEHLHGVFQQADRSRVVEQVFSGFCVGK